MALPELTAQRREHLLELYDLSEPDPGVVDELADIVDLARRATGAETSQLNVLRATEQLTVHEAGIPTRARAVPLSASVCSILLDHHADDRLIVIPDTAADPLLRDHETITEPPGIGSYAGAPLISPSGFAFGMLCVWSATPRDLNPMQRGLLHQLGNAAMHILETRRRAPTHTNGG